MRTRSDFAIRVGMVIVAALLIMWLALTFQLRWLLLLGVPIALAIAAGVLWERR